MKNEIKKIVNEIIKDFTINNRMFTYHEIFIETSKKTDKDIDYYNLKEIIDDNFLLNSLKDNDSAFIKNYNKTTIFLKKINSYILVFHPQDLNPNDYNPIINKNKEDAIEERLDFLIKNIKNKNNSDRLSYLELIELIVDIENEYNLFIDPDDCKKMGKDEFISYIKKLVIEDKEIEDKEIEDKEIEDKEIEDKEIKKDSKNRICVPKKYVEFINLKPYDESKVIIENDYILIKNENSTYYTTYNVDKNRNIRLSSRVLKDANLFNYELYLVSIKDDSIMIKGKS